MKEEVRQTLTESAECLTDAEVLYSQNRNKAAVSRAYYAIFHAARAALLQIDVNAFTHQGVNIQFSKYFIKTGIFDKNLIRTFNKLLDARQKSDYEVGFNANPNDALSAVNEAKTFYQTVFEYLNAEP